MFIEEHNINTIRLLDKPLYEEFLEELSKINLNKVIDNSKLKDLDYSIKVSSVYSSNIEGNPIDINSYMRIENNDDQKYQELKRDKSIIEINDLKEAYEYTMKNELNEINFLYAHKLISKELKISKTEKGEYRIGKEEVIYDESGIRYIAIETKYVKDCMSELFQDINFLLKKKLSNEEVIYFAILLHLIFVNVHPFRDGNGRCARLLQKWFLANYLGKQVFNFPFESYLAKNLQKYYDSLSIGSNFYDIEYKLSLPFFKLFIHALKLFDDD